MKKDMNKNDRRYAYTHNVIKDAMLELLKDISFKIYRQGFSVIQLPRGIAHM